VDFWLILSLPEHHIAFLGSKAKKHIIKVMAVWEIAQYVYTFGSVSLDSLEKVVSKALY
jgi:hypothetical protein